MLSVDVARARHAVVVFVLLLLTVVSTAWLAETLAPTIRASFENGPTAVDSWNRDIRFGHASGEWRPHQHASLDILPGCACILAIMMPTVVCVTALNPYRNVVWGIALVVGLWPGMVLSAALIYEFAVAVNAKLPAWQSSAIVVLLSTCLDGVFFVFLFVTGKWMGIEAYEEHVEKQKKKKTKLAAVDSDSDTCSDAGNENETASMLT